MHKFCLALVALACLAGCDRFHRDTHYDTHVIRHTTVVQPVHTIVQHTTVVQPVQRTVQSVTSRVSNAVSRSRSSSSSSRSSSRRRR